MRRLIRRSAAVTSASAASVTSSRGRTLGALSVLLDIKPDIRSEVKWLQNESKHVRFFASHIKNTSESYCVTFNRYTYPIVKSGYDCLNSLEHYKPVVLEGQKQIEDIWKYAKFGIQITKCGYPIPVISYGLPVSRTDLLEKI